MERKFFENDWIWDIETYPNICSFTFMKADGSKEFVFEISSRNYELNELLEFCRISKKNKYRWVGFNSLGFDYPVVHWILKKAIDAKSSGKKLRITPNQIYKYAMKVINSRREGEYGITVRDSDILVKQLDLFKMCHYDNKAKLTSLKLLEFNMRLKNLEDLPFTVGSSLTNDEMGTLIEYNKWDVFATKEFYHHCYDAIDFREFLTDKYNFDCTNLNDGKVGSKFFMKKIEEIVPNAFHENVGGREVLKKTPRDFVVINDCIFDYVRFKGSALRSLKLWFSQQVITETKGVFKNIEENRLNDLAKHCEMVVKKVKFQSKPSDFEILEFKKQHPLGWIEEVELKATELIKDSNGDPIKEEYICEKSGKLKLRNKKRFKKSHYGCYNIAKTLNVVIGDFRIDFGVGGLHGSKSGHFKESNDFVICDLDVKSYYPNLAISNRVYPEHLNEVFCDAYEEFYIERTKIPKTNPVNKAYKDGLNIVYGDSNSEFSAFYDPKYTMTITVNGQLSLCMLIERLVNSCNINMIQANTDGFTFMIHKDELLSMKENVSRWEKLTGLEMEDVYYREMFIRDVNNYIGVYTDGKIKSKGAYEYKPLRNMELTHMHKNHSALVVPMAVESELLNGVSVSDFIRNHKNEYDFMLRAKVPRSCRLVLIKDGIEIPQQNVCRYYPSTSGGELVKIMPPLEGKDEDRYMAVEAEYLVNPCNNMDDFNWDINYDYYINEAEKLLLPLKETIYK